MKLGCAAARKTESVGWRGIKLEVLSKLARKSGKTLRQILFACLLMVVPQLSKSESQSQRSFSALEELGLFTSYRSHIGAPLRFYVVASDTALDPEQFARSIEARDTKNVLAHGHMPESVSEMDLLIYLLNDWKEVSSLPGSDVFDEQVMRNEHNENNQIISMERSRFSGGELDRKDFAFVFLKVGELKDEVRWRQCLADGVLLMLADSALGEKHSGLDNFNLVACLRDG